MFGKKFYPTAQREKLPGHILETDKNLESLPKYFASVTNLHHGLTRFHRQNNFDKGHGYP